MLLLSSRQLLIIYQPIHFRNWNSGATSLAQQLQIGEVRVFMRDVGDARPFSQSMAAMGVLDVRVTPVQPKVLRLFTLTHLLLVPGLLLLTLPLHLVRVLEVSSPFYQHLLLAQMVLFQAILFPRLLHLSQVNP